MTPTELQTEQRNAEKLARAIGGTLAILLLHPSVTFTNGQFVVNNLVVTSNTIRKQLTRLESHVAAKMIRLADRLERGVIDVAEWREGMFSLIGSSHVVAGALAAGSIAAALANSLVTARIDSERNYAQNFSDSLKTLSASRIKARSKSYLLAAALTFAGVERVVRRLAGYTEARRILRASESCEGCLAYANQWMPINEIPPLGTLQCQNRCRCYMEYR